MVYGANAPPEGLLKEHLPERHVTHQLKNGKRSQMK